jgi:F-type H+-transporting ATPase subunit epsilon
MNKFKIEILSPEGMIFKEEIESASFPAASGVITVFAGHENLVTKLKFGEIIINAGENAEPQKISVSGGFVEIINNNVNVVVEFAVNSDDANKGKIEQAVRLAKEMKNKRKEFVDISVIESQLKTSVADLKSGLGLKRKAK